MALTGVIPPGTLSITNGLWTTSANFTVPILNISRSNDDLLVWTVRTVNSKKISFTKPKPEIQRMASQASLNARPVSLLAPAANATYGTKFLGPGLQCKPPNLNQQASFDTYNRNTLIQTGVYNVQQYLDKENKTDPPNWLQYYSAFSPQLHVNVTDTPIDSGIVDLYGNWKAMGPLPNDRNWDLGVQIWVQLSNQSLICSLTNASYDITFQYVNGIQTTTQNSVVHLTDWKNTYVSRDYADYIGYMSALGTVLYGNMSVAGYSCNITDSKYKETPGRCYMLSRANSQIGLTGLTACDEFQNSWWEQNADMMSKVHTTPSQPWTPPNDYTACRNKTLARAIEDLAVNMTISMLGLQM
jgi:hypothetical protein